MPLDATSMGADLDAIASDYAGSITHNGTTISGTVSPIEKAGELDPDLAGVSGRDVLTFVGKVSAFADEPELKDPVTYNNDDWIIAAVTVDAACYTLRLMRA